MLTKLSLFFILLTGLVYADNPPETIYDEGTRQGVAYRLNCVGAGIACTQSGITGTITVGGGGSASAAGGLGAVQYGSPAGTFAGDETKVSINPNGNVGIGTTNGLALFSINSSAAQDLFRVDDSAGSDATPFIIDQTGNVGIGTATPLAVVAISSTLNQALFRVDDNGNGDLSPFIIDASGNVGIGTTNTERDALLVMSGNVGIGTWVPSTKLDVAGTIVTTAGGNIGIGTVAPGQALDVSGNARIIGTNQLFFGNDNKADIEASATTTPALIFKNNSTESMRITNGNNVGIGTISPQGALTVMSGNVGIGTWAPTQILAIGANMFTVTAAGAVSSAGTNTANSFFCTAAQCTVSTSQMVSSATTVAYGSTSATSASNAVYRGGGAVNSKLILTPSSVTINGGSLEMRSGNVGIGTISPLVIFDGGNVGIGTLTGTGNLGIGTTLPAGRFTINGAGGTLLSQQATAPTVANNDCGTTAQGTVVAKSTDLSGTVTVGTLAVTSCAVTFNTAFNGAPNCICMDDSNVLAVRCTASTTKLTIVSATSMSSDLVTWWCPSNI